MSAEKIAIRTVQTPKGAVATFRSPLARQTYVALPTNGKNRAATYPASVAAIHANNARQSHTALS